MALRGANPRALDSRPSPESDPSGQGTPLASQAESVQANPIACPLERTFLHLPRIGLRTERKFWSEGIKTWDDLEASRRDPPVLFGPRKSPLLQSIDESRRALDAEDTAFFAERLPPGNTTESPRRFLHRRCSLTSRRRG